MKINKYEEFCYNIMDRFPSIKILKNVDMKNYTTFKIGGIVKYMVIVTKPIQMLYILNYVKSLNIRYFILGKGSNLLVSDKLKDIICIKNEIKDISYKNNKLFCGAGNSIFEVMKATFNFGLSGFEWAFGIPGTIGGAVVMNAGAFNMEMSDVLDKVCFTDGEKIVYKSAKELLFSYRHSIFQDSDFVVLGASINLQKGDKQDIINQCNYYLEKRKLTQPYDLPSAGSVFKRPDKNIFAPVLIQGAGLKGIRKGDAQVSLKHCGFIVNLGRANFKSVLFLIKKIKKDVFNKYKTKLSEEIKIIK